MTLSSRQRVLAAMNHRAPDAVPLDIGGAKTTSLSPHAYDALKAHLGFTHPTEIAHYRGQRTHMAEEMSRALGSDVRRVHVPYPAPWPPQVSAAVQCDEWGNEWRQAEIGPYYVSRSPLADADSPADLRRHPWPDPATLVPGAALAAAARKLRGETDCAICLDLPDGVVHLSQFLRGFARWLADTAENLAFLERLMDYVTDIYVAMVGPLLDAVGANVDLVIHCDDIAMQSGPLISPRVYRQAIKPRQQRIFDAIKAHTPAKFLFHSCGSLYWALPDLIDMGVDGINPVQVSAAKMDTAVLKREFGDKLFFWGGIDTQHVLPYGTPDEVRAEVQRRIADLAGDGGYIVGSVHIIQSEVPARNVVAMAEAARR